MSAGIAATAVPGVDAILRSPAESASLDWPRLADHLARQGHRFDPGTPPRQFRGGLGNLNFLVNMDGRPCVLRRPPFGIVPIGANDMAREHRVLSRLWKAWPLAPQSLYYCADESVLGAHFLVMEYRPGLVIGHELPAGLEPRVAGAQLSAMLVRLLASLHAVDPAAVGLDDFGKPDGFLARTASGWAKRGEAVAQDGDRRLIAELAGWLAGRIPPEQPATLLHSDFKLDNVVLDPRTLEPRAVLDWDMATRGDPLYDLATLLSYWVEPSDPEPMHRLRQMPTGEGGFHSRAQVMSGYAALTGRDLSEFHFYRVLTLFKLGVVFLQLYSRYRSGATAEERYAGFGELGHGILEFTHEVMRGAAS